MRSMFCVLALLTLTCFFGFSVEASATKQNSSILVNDTGTFDAADFGCATGSLLASESETGNPTGKESKDFSFIGATASATRTVTVTSAKAGYRITKPFRRAASFGGRQIGKFLF